jgi:hypothetical protein
LFSDIAGIQPPILFPPFCSRRGKSARRATTSTPAQWHLSNPSGSSQYLLPSLIKVYYIP